MNLRRRLKILSGSFVFYALLLPSFLIFSFLISSPVNAATVTWDGDTDADWETDANWDTGSVPGADDDVVIDIVDTVNINGTTTINSLAIGANNAVTLNFDYDAIADGALIIDDGNLTLSSGSTITHTDASGATINGKIYINVQSGDATIDGNITINKKGYTGGIYGGVLDGYGTGGGYGGDTHSGSGAGHGGSGGRGYGEAAGTYYSSLDQDTTINLGSGGGAGDEAWSIRPNGGDGGGAVKIVSDNGSLTVSGTINANGENGDTGKDCCGGRGAGGGSGGSIYLYGESIDVSGTLTADGGDGGIAEWNVTGGGGGGGIIYLYYKTTKNISGTLSVDGGSGSSSSYRGGTGIAFVEKVNSGNNDLYIPTDNGIWNQNQKSSWTYGDLNVDNDISFKSYNGELFTISSTGTTTIAENITLVMYGSYTTNSDGSGIYLNLTGDVTIPATTTITATGRGYGGGGYYASGSGPAGGNSSSDCGGGGGYGGTGRNGVTGGVGGNPTYGSNTSPLDLGSGGAGGKTYTNYSPVGGAGGGAIRINTDGDLTVSGTISADGNNGGSSNTCCGGRGGGAGAGGSIYLSGDSILGAGTISAHGGNGGVAERYGGGGGGGRIALYYATSIDFVEGDLNVALGSSGSGGTAGTTFIGGLPNLSNPAQYKSNGTTPVSTGGSVDETTVVLKVGMDDADASDTLTPEFEVKTVGTSFNDTATHTGSGVAYSGSTVTGSVEVSGLSDATSYHWQVRVCDATSNCTSWTSYGGNGEGVADFEICLNTSPNSPSSLGGHVSGAYIGDNTPTLTFTLSDDDAGDTVKYQIQIDNDSDFSSLVVDYTSVLAAQGSASFTVGQAAGSGSYSTGSEGQTLSADDYYWQVKAVDSNSASSSFVKGNSGSVAFKVDGTAPSAPGTASSSSSASDTTPTWTWTASTDSGAGLASTPYTVEWCDNSSFTDCGSNTATSDTNSYTHSSALTEGIWYFRIKAADEAGNESSYSSNGNFTIDYTGPAGLSLNHPSSDSYTTQTRPTFKWKVPTDTLSGISSYTFEIDNGDEGDFSISGIPATATSSNTHETSKYKATYIDFDDGNSDNDYIELQTKSTSDWSSTQNNGELKNTKTHWTVKAIDGSGNESSSQHSLYFDNSSPQLSSLTLNGESTSDAMATNQNTFTLAGRVTDVLAGYDTSVQFASGVDSAEIKIEEEDFLGNYSTYLTSSLNLEKNYWQDSGDKIDNNNLQTSDKYADFSTTLSVSIPNGNYKVTITGRDKAGNSSSSSFTVIVGPQAVTLTELEEEEEEEVVSVSPTPTPTEEPSPTSTPTPITKKITPPQEPAIQKVAQNISSTVQNVVQNTGKAVQQVTQQVAQQVKNITKVIPQMPRSVVKVAQKVFKPVQSFSQNTSIKIASTFEIWFSFKPTTISEVKVTEVGDDYAVVTWKTNHYATSKVNYGDSYDYGQDASSRKRTRKHKITLTDLEPGQTYYYEVMSEGKNYAFDARHEFQTSNESLDYIDGEGEVKGLQTDDQTSFLIKIIRSISSIFD